MTEHEYAKIAEKWGKIQLAKELEIQKKALYLMAKEFQEMYCKEVCHVKCKGDGCFSKAVTDRVRLYRHEAMEDL